MNPTKSSKLALSLLISATFLLVNQGSAATLASDSFDYSTGAISGQEGGTGWTEGWVTYAGTPTNYSRIVDPGTSLSYNSGGISIDGGNRALSINGNTGTAQTVVQRQFNLVTSDTVYLRFLMRLDNDVFDGNDFIASYLDITGNSSAVHDTSLTGLTSTPSDGSFFARLENSPPRGVISAGTANVDETYLVIMRLEKGVSTKYETISLWVNPSSTDENSPDATATDAAGFRDSMDRFGIWTGSSLENSDVIIYDELVIANDWNTAVAIPESSSVPYILAAFCGGLYLIWNRRVRNKR